MAKGLLNLPADGGITPESMLAKMHLNPQQAQQLQRIVLAGRKVMFSQKSHRLMLDQMNGMGTLSEKLGKGIAGLMGLLLRESRNSLPPNLIVPAGMVLLAHAAQFLRQSGQQVSDQDVAGGIESMTSAILHSVGVSPEKLGSIGERATGAPAAPAKGAPKGAKQ